MDNSFSPSGAPPPLTPPPVITAPPPSKPRQEPGLDDCRDHFIRAAGIQLARDDLAGRFARVQF